MPSLRESILTVKKGKNIGPNSKEITHKRRRKNNDISHMLLELVKENDYILRFECMMIVDYDNYY